MTKWMVKIAMMQFDIAWNDVAENLSRIDTLLQRMSNDVDVVVLPEMFATGFCVSGAETATSVEESVPLMWMVERSSQYQCAFCGSLAVLENGNLFNRFYFVKPDGGVHHYDKRHLFRLSDEPINYTPGSENVVVHYLGWKFSLAVCYDLRFPAWLRNSLDDKGYMYDVLLVVANWPASRSFAWQTLLPARSIENQSYVVGVNRVGVDANGTLHTGNSLVCQWTGEPILDAGSVSGVYECWLDKDELDRQRDLFKTALDWDLFFFLK